MRKPVIAIDGYSSTGKSSISKVIANDLDLIHMDTGALYRGVTYFALKHCMEETGEINLEKLFDQLQSIKIEFKTIDHELQIYLNEEDISQQIRDKEVSANVSLIACQKEVRDYLMETQRSIAKGGGVILDGRDIGTVVLPDADYKFFLTATIEERTRRRFVELKSMGVNMLEEEVRENLSTRDKIDSEREISPLKKAEDAILIDNTNLTKMETILLIKSYILPL